MSRWKMRTGAPAGALLSVALAACGGGGGSSQHDNPGTSPTISGTAGKGVLAGAPIVAEEVTADGLKTRGTTSTAADGSYSLTLADYTSGPVILTVQGDGDSTMVCDLHPLCSTPTGNVAFGSALSIGGAFKMQALLSPLEGDGTRCITPLTEAAARRAKVLAGGDLSRVTAREAQIALSTLGSLFGGLDVQRTCVLDVTTGSVLASASPEQKDASFLAGGLLGIHDASEGENPVVDPAAAAERIADQVGSADGMVDKAFLQQVVDSTTAQLEASGESPESGALEAIQMLIDGTEGSQVALADLEPDPNVSLDSVDRAKQFVSDLRTLANSAIIDFQKGGPADAFAQDIKAAAQLVGRSTHGEEAQPSDVLESAADAFRLGEEVYRSLDGVPGAKKRTTVDSSGATQSATITVAVVDAATDRISVKGGVLDSDVDITGLVPHGLDSEAAMVTSQLTGTVTHRGTTPGGKLTVSTGTATLAQTADAGGAGGIAPHEGQSISAQVVARLETINTTTPTALDGDVAFDFVRCPTCSEDDPEDEDIVINPDQVKVTGTLTRADRSTQVTVALDLTNAATFDPDAALSATNTPVGKVSVSFNLDLGGTLPDYGVVATLDVSGFDASIDIPTGTAELRLTRGSSVITVTPAIVPGQGTRASTGRLTLANQVGDSVVIDGIALDGDTDDAIVGVMKVNDQQVGHIDDSGHGIIIRYDDGTFESI